MRTEARWMGLFCTELPHMLVLVQFYIPYIRRCGRIQEVYLMNDVVIDRDSITKMEVDQMLYFRVSFIIRAKNKWGK